jgi:hypothetical protein
MDRLTISNSLADVLQAAYLGDGTTNGVALRLWSQMRCTAVLDAIRNELTERSNARKQQGLSPIGKLGEHTRLSLSWATNCMRNAREHEQKMMMTAGLIGEQ